MRSAAAWMLSCALVVACSACGREPPRVTKAARPPSDEVVSGDSAVSPGGSAAAASPASASVEAAEWQPLPGGMRLLHLGAGTLRVSLEDGRYQLGAPVLLDWVARSGRAFQG
jgi:hypothetical protein